MAHYLSDEELTRTAPAEVAAFASPVPTQIVSNGEFVPLPQTREQQRVRPASRRWPTVSAPGTAWTGVGSSPPAPAWRPRSWP